MYEKYLKRCLDLFFSILALPIFCLVFIVIAPLIFIDDPGPIFYNAPRLGKNGKIFKMYKFRSMKVNSPDIRNSDGSTYNGENDPRVTRMGRILRKTSLDEVPQFLNVLCGDMSIIGPRAHLTTKFKGMKSLTPKERKRLRVRPGITGYNQAYYRNTVSAEQKIDNDNYYVDHISLALDVKILFKTIDSVLHQENIYVTPEIKNGNNNSK
ncbi:MAG: sugar transferase [Ruminococcus sp.]|uniref:sugar transferase n=1 Tax=Ruminococcus sp. TaxID=41978 RepID=UPI0025FC1145|nr:sugar transferase [Ruminococcus sp.]MCR5601009.1 sugar transferase [Ruminococcus sp.]